MNAACPTLLEPPRAARQPIYGSIQRESNGFTITHSDGRALCARPVTHTDTALLADLIARLSESSRRQRFFRPLPNAELIWQEAARVTHRAPQLSAALVATASECGDVCAIALAELVHDPAAPTTAELAVVVRDDHQRAGVGAQLLRRLIEVAGRRGVRILRATSLAENWAVRQLLRNLELPYHTEIRSGELTVWAELP